jgi:ankyrin repeat protein
MKKEGFPHFRNKEELKTSIDQGWDVNTQSNDLGGLVPLNWALQVGLFDCVKILLESKANPNIIESEMSCSALHFACFAAIDNSGNAEECIKLLLRHTKNIINAQTISGRTCIHILCYYQQTKSAKHLIDARADLEIRNNAGKTALEDSIYKSNETTTKFLLNNGAKLPSGKHFFSKKVSATIRKLKCIKRVLITFCALSKKTGAIHKDLRNPIAKMVWETREDEVWDQKEYFERDLKMRKIE